MRERLSTVPGLASPPKTEGSILTAYSFLEWRRKTDGAEGLWRIGDKLYDLHNFINTHPGGAEWIRLTQGTDITEVFESHHLTEKAEKLLPKFYVREAEAPRAIPLTLKPDGFFRTFKKRAVKSLEGVNYHQPCARTNLIADSLVSAGFLFSIVAAATQSYIAFIFAGLFLAWTTIIGHNYFHMRDNFRMYYFDVVALSSKEWRITHVLSHHTYPNTLWDFEVYAVEPFLHWYPSKDKSRLGSFISQLISPAVWSLMFFDQLIKRYYLVLSKQQPFEFRDFIPMILPMISIYFAPSVTTALKTWLLLILIASFFFGLIGFNAAHHHPEIFHDGDEYRKDLDWGLLELDAASERKVVDESNFLTLTSFGLHVLHHFLPTVDHSYLPLVREALMETCKDFGITMRKMSQWELIKGQFKQLARSETKKL